MAKKTSFGQFDGGAGQRAAAKPKAKRSANPNPTAPKPQSQGRTRAVQNLGEKVYGDMKRHRRNVLRMGS